MGRHEPHARSFQTHGPAILARLPDDARRAGWAEMLRQPAHPVRPAAVRPLPHHPRHVRRQQPQPESARLGGLSVRSTFFETIVHLHHQLRDRGIVTGEEVKKIIGAEVESAAPGYSYWKCDQDNKKKQCVVHVSREFRGVAGKAKVK